MQLEGKEFADIVLRLRVVESRLGEALDKLKEVNKSLKETMLKEGGE